MPEGEKLGAGAVGENFIGDEFFSGLEAEVTPGQVLPDLAVFLEKLLEGGLRLLGDFFADGLEAFVAHRKFNDDLASLVNFLDQVGGAIFDKVFATTRAMNKGFPRLEGMEEFRDRAKKLLVQGVQFSVNAVPVSVH